MHTALRIQSFDCFSHIATRELLHDFFECRVFLPYDLIKPGRLDPRFLELLIRSARFDRFMLACHLPAARGRFPLADGGTHSSASCSRDSIRRECRGVFVRRAALRSVSDAAAMCSIRFPLLRVFALRAMSARSLPPYSSLARRLRGSQLKK